ncbi:DUF2013 domain-containing protein [Mycena venus]|uniref:DUF2013 domain-containing protein n=1 Tax=Mycena venus TaxID=2733690 RepID=A0A8H6XKM3_9AGAR|nr:DUF2013 domain-containing protein [Mycena venus]
MAMEDDLGIVYLVENAQQFWSELEDILELPKDEAHTLSLLDATLKRYLALCAAYHEQYLQSPLQLEHACNLIVESELFAFHSERMCEILGDEARSNTDPHSQLIFYHVLLCHGRRRSDFFRSHKRWVPLLPLLMDHVLVDFDSDAEDTYFGTVGGSSHSAPAVPIPIEAKLRGLCIRLLYEVCRVQRFSVQDLRIFDDAFIDYMFDLVEQTKHMQDETFNYSVIKLIVALNEQFMVASLPNESDGTISAPAPSEPKNRVLRVLMRRLGHSKTFGENMIFMLNRAQRTPEDLCMQLLVLKILYLLFTTKGTSEYFYTNDLCVLVDVFLRELVDLDDESESLRHTYLRVLHPLLTKTQLRDVPYKRPQIVFALESLTGNTGIRDVSPTTKRPRRPVQPTSQMRRRTTTRGGGSGSSEASARAQSKLSAPSMSASAQLERSVSSKGRTLKSSKSVEFLKGHSSATPQSPTRSALEASMRRPSNASSINLVAGATAPTSHSHSLLSPTRKGSADSGPVEGSYADRHRTTHMHHSNNVLGGGLSPPTSYVVPGAIAGSLSASSLPSTPPSPIAPIHVQQPQPQQRRSAPPPPPPKRRKPPAIPSTATKTNGGATITTIRSTVSSPLARSKF